MNSKRCVDLTSFVGSARWVVLEVFSLILFFFLMGVRFFFLGDESQHEWGVVYGASRGKADGAVREQRKHHIDRFDERHHHEQGSMPVFSHKRGYIYRLTMLFRITHGYRITRANRQYYRWLGAWHASWYPREYVSTRSRQGTYTHRKLCASFFAI